MNSFDSLDFFLLHWWQDRYIFQWHQGQNSKLPQIHLIHKIKQEILSSEKLKTDRQKKNSLNEFKNSAYDSMRLYIPFPCPTVLFSFHPGYSKMQKTRRSPHSGTEKLWQNRNDSSLFLFNQGFLVVAKWSRLNAMLYTYLTDLG